MKFFLLSALSAALAKAADTCIQATDTAQICVSEAGVASVAMVNGTTYDSMVGEINGNIDQTWVMVCGCLVFFMQAGFSMLEAGCVSSKNVQNILYKNLMDACIGACCFWAFGYGFAYGGAEPDNGFIGTGNFFLSAETDEGATYGGFFFQWAFAATAATIVSGSVAERTKLSAYFVYSIFLTTIVYPVVVHWVWDSDGWISAFSSTPQFSGTDASNGMIDFAGSGVVHMVGGFSGLMGAIAVGPRLGRFEEAKTADGQPIVIKEHNKLLASLGVCILWFGWYGFNGGSTLGVSGNYAALAGKVCVTTTLAAAFAAVTCTIYSRIVDKNYDLMLSLNGVLAGLVSITANCNVVEPWAAAVIGILGAFVYIGASALLKKLKIDDPLDAFPIHGCCGVWGVLCAGIFPSETGITFGGYNTYDAMASGEQFGVQAVGVLAIIAWTVGTSGAMFFIMKATMGVRVPEFVEKEGLDLSEHGGAAYAADMTGLIGDGSTKVKVASA